MKSKFTNLVRITSIFFLFTTGALAQGGMNIIKINLSSPVISHYQVQYERVLDPKHSWAISFGISPDVGLPFKDDLLEQFGDNEDAIRAIESTKFNKITVTPEYRIYTGTKGAPAGFYFAPFIRYTHMSLEQIYTFTPSDSVEREIPIKGKFDGVGAGSLIGIQWTLGEYVTLDWWIAGPFIGIMNSNFHGADDKGGYTDQDRKDLEEDIESVTLPLWTVEATVTETSPGVNEADVELKGPFFGFRAFGFALGFRF